MLISHVTANKHLRQSAQQHQPMKSSLHTVFSSPPKLLDDEAYKSATFKLRQMESEDNRGGKLENFDIKFAQNRRPESV